jgi:DNA-binding MurR/RpiR family transcriptional regulator
MDQGGDSEEPIYLRVFNLERSLMEEALGMMDPLVFDRCVELIRSSDEVLLVGCSPNGFLVDYAYSFLRLYRDGVRPVKELDLPSLGMIMDSLPKRTTAIVFSFPRYPRGTQRIIEMLHDRGVRTIGITDSEMSPIVPFSDDALFTPHKYLIVTDPAASAVSLVHALLVGLYRKDPQKYKKRLQKYEEVANESDIFVSKGFSFAEML